MTMSNNPWVDNELRKRREQFLDQTAMRIVANSTLAMTLAVHALPALVVVAGLSQEQSADLMSEVLDSLAVDLGKLPGQAYDIAERLYAEKIRRIDPSNEVPLP